jgi:MarR family transcriptional regulator, lower aerobic nicotinate degradation pathway regulator
MAKLIGGDRMPGEKKSSAGGRAVSQHDGGLGSYDFSVQVGHLLRKAYQRHTSIFQKLAVDPQLTAVQFVALCVIAENTPCFLTTIGRAAALDPATTRGVVERLSKRGLITVAQDQVDKRRVVAELQDSGRQLIAEMIPRSLKITEATVARLSPAERVALDYLLVKIADPED